MSKEKPRVHRPHLQVLAEVNAVMAHYGLAEWEKIGLHSRGEFEITGVVEVVDNLWSSYLHIKFAVIRPDGSDGTYAMRFNKKPSLAVCALVGGQVLLVKQHRLAFQRWTVEIPRGWAESVDDPEQLVREFLAREFDSCWVTTLTPFNLVELGSVAEDTGTRANIMRVFLVEADSAAGLPGKKLGMKPMLVDWGQIDAFEEGGGLSDAFSLSVLRKVERHISRR